MTTCKTASKWVVVVRGYNGIEDAQVVSSHRTRAAAEKRAENEGRDRTSAANYNARYSIEAKDKASRL